MLFILISLAVWGSYAQTAVFEKMTDSLEGLSTLEMDSVIAGFVSSKGGLPMIEGNKVIFMVRTTGSQPHILSGFNGFLNPRYISDPAKEGAMIRISTSNWFYYLKSLAPDARIFYQFEVDGSVFNDPLNPMAGYRFNLVNSELRMPGYEIPEELVIEQFVPRGTVHPEDIYSRQLDQTRNVQVYTPAGYESMSEKLPALYFHDGSMYVEWGRIPQILDFLIFKGFIPPLVAVFDDPVNRGQEYRGDPGYIRYVADELVPFVDSNYLTRSQPQFRAVIGGSKGGLSSLILSHSTNRFSKCGVFSPAIYPRELEEFKAFLSTASHSPGQVVVLGAVYDRIWYQDALALKNYFEAKPIDFRYSEVFQGHNLQAWVPELDSMLKLFFGPGP